MITIHGIHPSPPMPPVDWVTDLPDNIYEDLRHLLCLNELYIVLLHVATSSFKLHVATSTPWDVRKITQFMVGKYLPYTTRDQCDEVDHA